MVPLIIGFGLGIAFNMFVMPKIKGLWDKLRGNVPPVVPPSV